VNNQSVLLCSHKIHKVKLSSLCPHVSASEQVLLKHGVDSSALKMGPIGCPETPVRNYHYSLRDIPEEFGSHGVGVYTQCFG
jgi:hypothetical protein